MGLWCCYAGEMHRSDAPYRVTTWANYITTTLTSPREEEPRGAGRAANEERPRAPVNAWGRILRDASECEAFRAPELAHALEHKVANGSIAAAEAGGPRRRLRERVQAIALGILLVAEVLDFGKVLRALADELLPQDDLHDAILTCPSVDFPSLVVKAVHDAVHESHVGSPFDGRHQLGWHLHVK